MGVESAIKGSAAWMIGEDRTIRIDVKQSDGSTAQTMTGWALAWDLYDKPGGTSQISKTTSAGISIGNGSGTDDRASITIDDVDTEGLDSGRYFHVLRRTDAGSEQALSYGEAVLQDVGIS